MEHTTCWTSVAFTVPRLHGFHVCPGSRFEALSEPSLDDTMKQNVHSQLLKAIFKQESQWYTIGIINDHVSPPSMWKLTVLAKNNSKKNSGFLRSKVSLYLLAVAQQHQATPFSVRGQQVA